MMIPLLFAASMILFGILFAFWITRFSTRTTLKEFERMFPGQCPICSLHRFGVREGYERNPFPPPHAGCPDRQCYEVRAPDDGGTWYVHGAKGVAAFSCAYPLGSVRPVPTTECTSCGGSGPPKSAVRLAGENTCLP